MRYNFRIRFIKIICTNSCKIKVKKVTLKTNNQAITGLLSDLDPYKHYSIKYKAWIYTLMWILKYFKKYKIYTIKKVGQLFETVFYFTICEFSIFAWSMSCFSSIYSDWNMLSEDIFYYPLFFRLVFGVTVKVILSVSIL